MQTKFISFIVVIGILALGVYYYFNLRTVSYPIPEFGISLRSGADQTVSSPFRRDSNASFRCYYHPDTDDYDAFDWGSGKYYTAVSLLMEAKNFTNFGDVINYARSDYGVSISKNDFYRNPGWNCFSCR